MKKSQNNILKIFIIIGLAAILVFCASACEAGNRPEETEPECTKHTDADNNGKCDICGSEVESEKCTDHIDIDGDNKCEICGATVVEPIQFSIKLSDETGMAITNISVSVKYGSEEIISGVTDANGSFTGEILPDTYSIYFDGMPEGWVISGNGSPFNFTEENSSFTFSAVDNNPDGSEKKPYYLGDEPITEELSAGVTYHFFKKGSDGYLVIRDTDVKVTYNGQDYFPENGVLRVLIHGTDDTNSTTDFTVTANVSHAVTLVLEAIPGSLGAPYDAVIGENTASVQKDRTIYYRLSAPADGYLTIYSSDSANHIMMYNIKSLVATGYTEGTKMIVLAVNAGDDISISVAARSSEENYEFKFDVAMYVGDNSNPLVIKSNCALRLPANGSIKLICAANISSLTLSASGFSLADEDGDLIEATDGKYIIEANDGAVFTLTNTRDVLTDADVKVTEKASEADAVSY